jgi:hypothetical protein
VHVVVRRPRLRGRNASVRAAGNTGKKSGDVHGTTVDWLNEMLVPLVKGKAIVRVQGMIRLSQLSEPEPDIVLLKPRAGRYIDVHLPERIPSLPQLRLDLSGMRFS